MTPRQIELARHALGLTNGRRVAYRNYFAAGPGHVDFEEWMAMVRAGDARVLEWTLSGSDNIFKLSRSAADAVLRPGEELDPEWVTRSTRMKA